ncbi:hypothetical protein FRY77_27640 [Halomonas sp. MG34]|nr:hypothetical protein [Halomonas sp. MG34]
MTQVLFTESTAIEGVKYGRNQIYNLTGAQLKRALESDVAYQFDMPQLKTYENQASQAVAKFKKAVGRIEGSLDPRFKDEQFKQSAIDESKATLKDEVEAVQRNYEDALEALREEAKKAVAQQSITVNPNDANQAQLRIKQIAGELALGHGDGALDQLATDLERMTEERKQAIGLELPTLMGAVTGDKALERKVKAMYEQAKPVLTSEEVFMRGINAVSNRVDQEYTQLKMISRYFDDEPRNIHNPANAHTETVYTPITRV